MIPHEGNDDRRKHDLEDGHVPEIKNSRKPSATPESGLFQEKPKKNADQASDHECGAALKEIKAIEGPVHNHSLLTK